MVGLGYISDQRVSGFCGSVTSLMGFYTCLKSLNFGTGSNTSSTPTTTVSNITPNVTYAEKVKQNTDKAK